MSSDVRAEQLVALGMEPAAAETAARRVSDWRGSLPLPQCWMRVAREILSPAVPFPAHRFLFETVFEGWDAANGPAPAWTPTPESAARTNIGSLMQERGLASYAELHAWSIHSRAEFWQTVIRRLGIRFARPCAQVMNLEDGVEKPRWLEGAAFNIVESCFQAAGQTPAIVYQGEGAALSTLTYAELEALVNCVANGLTRAGYRPGDALACCLPMGPESVAVYLGILKAGCVAVSIAESFAPSEIGKRLRLSNTRAVFTQDAIARGGKQLPLYEKVVAAGAAACVVLPGAGSLSVTLRASDVAWDAFLGPDAPFKPVLRGPADCVNILFSSGTTADPKAIPWTQTAPIKCAADAWLHHDIQPGDVLAWPTSLGWMMGPWLVFASLVNRATMALFGGAPTGREFAQFVQEARVTMLGVVPSLVKAWRERESVRGLDWTRIRAFSSTGECSNADDYLYLMALGGYKPVIEYCGGTEIAGGYITGTLVQAASPATFSTPALGLDFVVLDEAGHPAQNGEVFLIPPSIGLSNELLNRDHHEVYFEGTPRGPRGETLRRHGDQIERLGNGFFRAHGRVDDTMNLGGIKVSSAELERTLDGVAGVRETAAVAITPTGGGPDSLVVYAVLEQGVTTDPQALKTAMQARIKEQLNPLFRIHDVMLLPALPRTASNKVMHRKLRADYPANGKGV